MLHRAKNTPSPGFPPKHGPPGTVKHRGYAVYFKAHGPGQVKLTPTTDELTYP